EDTKEPSEVSDETAPFEEDETTITPPPPPKHCGARKSVRPQTPMAASTQALIDAFAAGSSSFSLPSTSPAYDQAPLEKSAAAARAPRSQYDFVDTVEVGQGLIRSLGHDAQTIARDADRAEDVGYVRALHTSEQRMMIFIKEVNLRTNCRDIRLEIDIVRGQRTAYEIELQERQSVEDLAVTQIMRIHALEARARTDTVEDVSNSVNTIIRGCTLNFMNHPFNIDLMPVPLGSFDVIIGMDWLTKYHGVIICDEKIGCDVFLAHITTKEAKDKSDEKRLENVPIVKDFPKVFPEDLSSIPPARQIELELPQQLSRVHNTFHVSNLKKCLSDDSLVILLDELRTDDKLHFVEEPVEIMDHEIKQLKRSRIPIIKVRWNSKRGPEFT
nr:putative reverse transcriptase domain-containing protein [Tanacetum cinerariifolium]